MFNFKKIFRKRNGNSISERIDAILQTGDKSLHVNLFVGNQIIFQLVPAKNYTKMDLEDQELKGFLEMHFFNRNKSLTIQNEIKAKELLSQNVLKFYEDPPGNKRYYASIESNAKAMEELIFLRMKGMYSNIDINQITIEYLCL